MPILTMRKYLKIYQNSFSFSESDCGYDSKALQFSEIKSDQNTNTIENKMHSENADNSTSVTFDLEL